MTHILIVYEGVEPGNIETCRVHRLLEERGLLVSRGLLASQVKKEDMLWCDVLLLVRSTSLIERDLAALAKKMGKFVVLSIDDDFLSLGSSYGADGSGYWGKRHDCLKSILNHIDCLLTVNRLLAEKYITFCHTYRYVVTNTIVEENEMYLTSQDGEHKGIVKLAIYVNDGSNNLFNVIMRPALHMLAQKYANRLAIYLMALHPDMSEFEGLFEVHFVPHMPYKEFKRYLGTEGFDIGLAPLIDTGFFRYKYFNKYIEYTLAGIPAVFSDCPLYRMVIQDGYNGLFTDNSKEGWSAALSRMIESADLRLNLINNAQRHLYDNFQADAVLYKLIYDIPEFTEYKCKTSSISFVNARILLIKLKYYCFRVGGWLNTAVNMLKHGSFKLFWKRLKTRILKV
ncbi:glycosyltransferase [Bacteroides intestinalis]|jgi:hypothetical protein|uniref:glycosyltransferase n=1 Tax=Bacteroides intestinalis TaxID=329854 RepID=UPI000E489103|nr:glycosyltransferase [Bacteroides intestinalis]RGX85415.1 hypothetical protein DXA61_09455 [Bacteroides intestinalis]